MKKYLIAFTLLIVVSSLSTKLIAQDAPGDWNDGTMWVDSSGNQIENGSTSLPSQPTAFQFTRNNGDGTCGDKAQIRLYFSEKPSIAPHLSQIWYQGAELFPNFVPVNADMKNFETKGYVSFCLSVSNIPPAIKLTIDVTPSPIQPKYSLTGTN